MEKREKCWEALDFAVKTQGFREVISDLQNTKYSIRITRYFDVAKNRCKYLVKTKVNGMKRDKSAKKHWNLL